MPHSDAITMLSSTVKLLAETAATTLQHPKRRAEFVDAVVQCCTDFAREVVAHAATPPTFTPGRHKHVRPQIARTSSAEVSVEGSPHGSDSGRLASAENSMPVPSSVGDTMYCQSLPESLHIRVSEQLLQRVNDEGDKMINDYIVIGSLGRGSMGKVKLVVHNQTDQVFAVKILNKSLLMRIMKGDGMTALTQVQQEVAIMKKLNHKNVVKMHEVIDDPEKDKMYIVMDYVSGGSLFELEPHTGNCPAIPLDEIRRVMRQLCAGLLYLHRHGIVHRDIKPDNILIDRTTSSVYLSDFGVSEICGSDGLSIAPTMEGTPMYMAPEVYSADGATTALDGECLDVWAWGVTLYCMLYGKHPFMARSVVDARHKITQGTIVMPRTPITPDAQANPRLWQALVALLEQMLERDPSRRVKVKGVRTALRAMKATGSQDSSPQIAPENDDAPVAVNIADIQQSITMKSEPKPVAALASSTPVDGPMQHAPAHPPDALDHTEVLFAVDADVDVVSSVCASPRHSPVSETLLHGEDHALFEQEHDPSSSALTWTDDSAHAPHIGRVSADANASELGMSVTGMSCSNSISDSVRTTATPHCSSVAVRRGTLNKAPTVADKKQLPQAGETYPYVRLLASALM